MVSVRARVCVTLAPLLSQGVCSCCFVAVQCTPRTLRARASVSLCREPPLLELACIESFVSMHERDDVLLTGATYEVYYSNISRESSRRP